MGRGTDRKAGDRRPSSRALPAMRADLSWPREPGYPPRRGPLRLLPPAFPTRSDPREPSAPAAVSWPGAIPADTFSPAYPAGTAPLASWPGWAIHHLPFYGRHGHGGRVLPHLI